MPLRALLWDEELVAGTVHWATGLKWGEWVSSMSVDAAIGRAVRVQAWLFFGFALAALVPLRCRTLRLLYFAASLDLVFLAWLNYHEAGRGAGHFAEQAGQFCLPLVLLLVASGRRWALLAKLGIAVTFIGHGLFAIGLPSEIAWLDHTRPGRFTEMTMLCLRLESESVAGHILLVAGIIDLVAAALIFLRGWPRSVGLAYMVGWGFLTALARPWAYFEPAAASGSLLRWVPELLLRAPHFGLPLCLLLALRRSRAQGS